MPKLIESRQQAYKRITEGIRSFVNHSAGAANLVLEAKRLEIWKEKWSSWSEYCEKEFGKSRQRVFQLLQVAETVGELNTETSTMVDSESGKNKGILENLNRRHVSELKGLPPAKKAEVFAAATNASDGKTPTPKTIAAARKALSNGEPVVRDKTGYPVPENCLELWNRGAEIRSLIAKLGEVAGAIEKAQPGEWDKATQSAKPTDELWRECDFSSLLGHVGQLRVHLRKAEPYAICATCQGLNRDNCKTCKQRGMVSQDFYERCVPTEVKALRQKAYATSA